MRWLLSVPFLAVLLACSSSSSPSSSSSDAAGDVATDTGAIPCGADTCAGTSLCIHPGSSACPSCDPAPGDGGTCDAGALGPCPVGGAPACVIPPATPSPYCADAAPAGCCPSTGCTSRDVQCPGVACDVRR